MNENYNSSAVWRRGKSPAGRVHRFVVHCERTASPRPKRRRQTIAEYSRLELGLVSIAINTRPSLVAPASCRRFFAQPLRSTFASNLRSARGSARAFLIDTPKRLEFAVSSTKQTSRAISNRNKKGGAQNPLGTGSCSAGPACPELRGGLVRQHYAQNESRCRPAVRLLPHSRIARKSNP
jgi:hypothetical protein